MKKCLSLLLAGLLIFSFAGCGETLPSGTDSEIDRVVSSSSEKNTLSGKTDVTSQKTDTDSSQTSDEAEVKKTPEEVLAAMDRYVGLCDQKNGRVILCDLAEPDWTDDNAVVWEYVHDIQGRENYGWIAGLKFRHSDYYGGDVMLFCAPRSMGYIVSMETKEVLLTAEKAGANPHSVELLPNGTFIVGSSNDGLVSVYAPGESTPCYTLTLAGNDSGTPDVHGVLWDPEYETLWVSGGQKLRAFLVIGPETAPELTLYAEYDVPHNGLHDLAPDYSDTKALLLSTAGGIVKFDKDKEKFSYSYSCSAVGRKYEYIPGLGMYSDGLLVFTAITDETKVYQDWDTNVVFACIPLGGERRKVVRYKAPNDAYYKLRIFNTDYQ